MKKLLIFKTLLIAIGLLATSLTTQMWAGYSWRGNVFFRAPDEWGDLTNKKVQLGLAQGTSTTNSVYVYFDGNSGMERVGNTRLYYKWIPTINHDSWAKEYVVFTMNGDYWNSNSIKLNSCVGWTTPVDYGFASDNNPYLFNPDSESNGATLIGSYSSTGADYAAKRTDLLVKTQRVNLYTEGSESKTGGSVRIDGVYLTGNTTTSSGNATNGSNNYASYNCVIGSTVTLTATPATANGYYFAGWYTGATDGDLVSTSTSLDYTCTGAKTLYARFERRYSVSVSSLGHGDITAPATPATSVTAGYYTNPTITAANPDANYTFGRWICTGGASVANQYSATTTVSASATGTVQAHFVPNWCIKGSMSNDSWTTFYEMPLVSGTTWRGSITLAANTTYTFQVKDATQDKDNGWYGNSSAFVGQTSHITMKTSGGNCSLATAGAGTYIFEFNSSTKELIVTYPTVTHPSSDYVYFKNTGNWSNVRAYVYTSSGITSYDSRPYITSATMTFAGQTYYYAALGGNTCIIFSNDDDSKKTGNLTTASSNKGKYYDFFTFLGKLSRFPYLSIIKQPQRQVLQV